MVNFAHYLWFIVSIFRPSSLVDVDNQSQSKSITIIGAGSAGLAVLKALLDLPEATTERWNITLYEQTEDVGGIWLPDTREMYPPDLPYTPLYPLLRTNTPVPAMTYPGFPFPPATPLYPGHEHIQIYHKKYALLNNLTPYIRFQHRILETRWVGDAKHGSWEIGLLNNKNQTLIARTDHLIVATGNNHIPRIPTWPGQETWLHAGKGRRELVHSVYYRQPERYTNRTLLIIGAGASGQDAAVQTAALTQRTYVSVRHEVQLPPGSENVIIKGPVSHFSKDAVHFVDGGELKDVDSVLLATGYEQRKPFLEAAGHLAFDPSASSGTSRDARRRGTLVSNGNYIFPLHRHIFSLSPEYPVNALAFIGLPTRIANCPSDFAQGQFVAQVIAKPWILGARSELLDELARQEEDAREAGMDPYVIGHAIVPAESSADYQDELVEFLKKKKAIPDNGVRYVEDWRRRVFTYAYMKRGWARLQALGEADEWVKDVKTEKQWVRLMARVNAWQKRWEEGQNITFVDDTFVGGYVKFPL